MFIKLTKSDGSPVWLNPEFIVRIEAWKTGSAVAAAGDGDFEVRETPSSIFALIDSQATSTRQSAPTPPKAPPQSAPQPPAAQKTAVSEQAEVAVSAEPSKRKTRGRKKTAKQPAEAAPEPAQQDQASAVAENAEPPPHAPPEAPEIPADTLFPEAQDEVSLAAAILKKNRCRSRKRIENTLKSLNPKMSMADVRAMLQQMESRGFVVIDAQGHAVFT